MDSVNGTLRNLINCGRNRSKAPEGWPYATFNRSVDSHHARFAAPAASFIYPVKPHHFAPQPNQTIVQPVIPTPSVAPTAPSVVATPAPSIVTLPVPTAPPAQTPTRHSVVYDRRPRPRAPPPPPPPSGEDMPMDPPPKHTSPKPKRPKSHSPTATPYTHASFFQPVTPMQYAVPIQPYSPYMMGTWSVSSSSSSSSSSSEEELLGTPKESQCNKWDSKDDFYDAMTPAELSNKVDAGWETEINPLLEFNGVDPDDAKLWLNVIGSWKDAMVVDSRESFSDIKEEPLMLPRVNRVRIVNRYTPWPIIVTNPSGVTTKDAIRAICAHFRTQVTSEEWKNESSERREAITAAYHRNRIEAMEEKPGGATLEGKVCRGDFLLDATLFQGLVHNDEYTMRRFGYKDPATLELKLTAFRGKHTWWA